MSNERATYEIRLKDKFSQGFSRIDRNVDSFEGKVNRLSGRRGGAGGGGLGALSLMGGLAAGAIASVGYAAFETGKKIVSLGAEMEQARVAFSTMLGSAERGNELLRRLNEFSNFTPFNNVEVIKSGRTLLAMGTSASKVTDTLKLIGDVSSGLNQPLGEMALIFGQIQSTGKLTGERLAQLRERGFDPLYWIGKKLNREIPDLFEEMGKGAISAEMVTDAFKLATSESGKFFNSMEKQSRTFSGRMSTLTGKLQLYMANLGEKALPTLGGIVDELTEIVDLLANDMIDFSPFIDNLDALSSSFEPIIGVFNDFLDLLGFDSLSKLDKIQYALDTLALTMRLGYYPLRILIEGVSALGQVAAEASTLFRGLGAIIEGVLTKNFGLVTAGAGLIEQGLSNAGRNILANLDKFVEGEKSFYSKLYTQREQREEEGISLDGADSVGGSGSTSTAATSTARERVGSSIRGSSPKNVTLNVNKLIEQVVFQKYDSTNKNDLMNQIKSALLTSLNDVVIAQQ